MYMIEKIAPTKGAKVYLTLIYKLLSRNVPEELKIYHTAANEKLGTLKQFKSPKGGPTIAEMGLMPTK
jgi:hypothetical protein